LLRTLVALDSASMRYVTRLLRFLTWALAMTLVGIAAAWWAARPREPDAFYTPPGRVPSEPGELLRQEAFGRGVPANARAWRILHSTTRFDGTPALGSAIVMVSRDVSGGPRPIIAWTHGTTGVARGCAPSLLDQPFENVPALLPLIEQGWIYVATDYTGQGTPGPHPYLIGEGQARSALDAVRAARRIEGIHADARTVVCGHSQGGHSALWGGIVAPGYAPDVPIAGVAAIAPASDLQPLLDAVQHTPVGRIMSSFVLRAYSESYPDVALDNYVPIRTRMLARDMASRCLAGRKALFSVLEALMVGGTIFGTPPTSGALGKRLAQNTPDVPLRQPLLIAQGLADDLVLPQIQSEFVRRRCDAGQALEFRSYAGRDHLSIVAPDSPLTPDLVSWTQDRFAGVPPPAGCVGSGAKPPVAADTPQAAHR
jgi:alpha-beta hydrolase superfamily lysophospholipase